MLSSTEQRGRDPLTTNPMEPLSPPAFLNRAASLNLNISSCLFAYNLPALCLNKTHLPLPVCWGELVVTHSIRTEFTTDSTDVCLANMTSSEAVSSQHLLNGIFIEFWPLGLIIGSHSHIYRRIRHYSPWI